ncbi:MAG: acetyl-CoA acetyltransferase [Lysobacteraceae bacterium]|nr:MAG: acetyl-CoA acetyltransferase [Xanthomonadaceae bacterium]
MTDKVVIVGAKRTAIGSFQGQLASSTAVDLGAAAISAALESSGVSTDKVDEVIMGCVLPAGLGQAPARQASLAAGIPLAAGCTTINKVCGSGMKAIMLAHDLIRSGSVSNVVAGGMESMTNAPYLLPGARSGYRMGHQTTQDHMFLDGLQSPWDQKMMGTFGDQCASRYSFSREQQDAFATASVERAQAAVSEGRFEAEITPVTVRGRKGDTVVAIDEEPARCRIEKIPQLRPAFAKDGTITAANASKISDGAAATILMTESSAKAGSHDILANIVGHATHSQEPEWFTTAPVGAIEKLMKSTGWSESDVDLFEINEAFAVVSMAAMHDIGIDHSKVNVNGGACALGHPIGASGARLVVTLIHALQARGLKRGIAALCIGGGEATALAIELP